MKHHFSLHNNSKARDLSFNRMPARLIAIRDEASRFEAHYKERAQTEHRWMHQAEYLRHALPGLQIGGNGDTIMLGGLSPGCLACKAGKWDCLFLSMACNLSCKFCLTPCAAEKSSAISAMDHDLDELCEKYADSGIVGIGFSGGEPLLNHQKLLHFLSTLRKRLPDLYLWVYTNGLLLTKGLISALARSGLNELRFNTAATGYLHPHVSAMLRHAALNISCVAVEIPAIPEHVASIRNALPIWRAAGVRNINLHELIYEPGSPSATMFGARQYCRMPDGHVCAFNPHSIGLFADVLKHIGSGDLPLSVNFCSLKSKARQLLGRRRVMAAYTLKAYEKLCPDGEAERLCYFNETHLEFAHPATLVNWKHRPGGLSAARVRRLLPLTVDGPGLWTHFEIIHQTEEF
jgi:pyruvate formate-lyase activating enzyme-like uncharacterized protein